MRRALIVAVLAAFMVVLSAGAAFAGEWNKGHHNEPGGNIPAKDVAKSECLFNGQDEPDEDPQGEGNGEPYFPGGDGGALIGDDPLWSSTPAGAHNQAGVRVQSGGQLVAAFGPEGNAGAQGEACNGHLNPWN
jgi:hypothetical protein